MVTDLSKLQAGDGARGLASSGLGWSCRWMVAVRGQGGSVVLSSSRLWVSSLEGIGGSLLLDQRVLRAEVSFWL